MKILRKGKLPDLDDTKTRKFKCDDCGCVFLAGKGEYKIRRFDQTSNDHIYYEVKGCPCCGRVAIKWA